MTVTNFKYLGSVITDEGSKPEILSKIAQKTAALTRLKPTLKDTMVKSQAAAAKNSKLEQ